MTSGDPNLESGSDHSRDNLGAVVAGHRDRYPLGWIFLGLGLLPLAFGALVALTAVMGPKPGNLIPGSILLLIGLTISLGGVLILVLTWNTGWDFHERGVRVLRWRKPRVILYEDVGGIELRYTRRLWGMIHDITLYSRTPGVGSASFKHLHWLRAGEVTDSNESPNDVQRVCDHIVGLIAERMAERLKHGEVVQWIDKARLNSWGLEIWQSLGRWEQIRWEQIDRMDVSQRCFRLWVKEQTTPWLEVETTVMNFFPGYSLLLSRLQKSSEADTTIPPPMVGNGT